MLNMKGGMTRSHQKNRGNISAEQNAPVSADEPRSYLECQVKMNTLDGFGQQVICHATDHAHCGGCYGQIPSRTVWCSRECINMVLDYQAEVERDPF